MLGVWAVNAVIFACELRLWSYSIVLEQGGWSEEELNGTHFGSCCVKPQEGCKTRQASLARVMREREALLSFSSMVASILFLCLAMLLKQKEWYLYHYKWAKSKANWVNKDNDSRPVTAGDCQVSAGCVWLTTHSFSYPLCRSWLTCISKGKNLTSKHEKKKMKNKNKKERRELIYYQHDYL